MRRPGAADAVALGLAAVVGAGVFGVWAPATAAAGVWLPLAVVVAAVAAACTAAAGADVAQAHPGGCAVGGAALLAPAAARLAGVAYLLGRTAAAATAAAVFGSYVLPDRPVAAAVGVVLVGTGLTVAGVVQTARSAWALVGGVGAVLLVVVLVGVVTAGGDRPDLPVAALLVPVVPASSGAPGVLTAAGLVFFAYAGFGRFPLGSGESTAPRRVLGLTLGVLVLGYLAVAVALLAGLGADVVAATPAPLVALVDASGAPALGVLVRLGAAVACGSALLAVLGGWSRTVVTMAARGELRRVLGTAGSRPSGRGSRPWRADLLGGVAAVAVAVLTGPAGALAIAACALLVHHALVGLAGALLPTGSRTWPGAVLGAGAVLCVLLAVLLPLHAVVVTVAALAVLWVLSTLHLRWRASR